MFTEVSGIQIKIEKKNIKNMHLYVKPPDGRVEVSAPISLSDESIELFVRTKLGWIRKQQEKFAIQPRQNEREYVSGETMYLWGKQYYLQVAYSGKGNSIRIDGNNIVLTVRKESTAQQRENYVNEWYREHLKKQVEILVKKWENVTGLHPTSWQTKYMTTRWGTCNTKTGKVWFNLQLAKKPIECLEYVILHELIHLQIKNHGKDFIATIVCLVGGGQEINTGEAGISEWINALNNQFPHWKVYISPKLTDPEYAEGRVNELLKDNVNVNYSEDLHLGVSLRSVRAEKLSAFVHALLSFDDSAAGIYREIKDKYPIVLTRDMTKARRWLHDKVRGTERTGVLVTKESARFKPLAIHILPAGDENAVHWFLEDKADTRSSNYLEDAATEIQVQGLELDYTCLLWDADMRCENGEWGFYKFSNNIKWTKQIGNTEGKQDLMKYMLNAYRVLLTRARKGMVICVPEGNPNKTLNGFWEDSTRLPEFYDGTYEYLKSLGLDEI